MKLRWVTTKNRITANEILEFRQKNPAWGSLPLIKEYLEYVEGPTLQYFDEATGDWEDVPEVLEYRN